MGERRSEYDRDGDDWYIEPAWSVLSLRARIPFVGQIHDPCCGMGTIPKVMGGTGADIKDRGFGYPQQDYLQDTAVYDNIVTNPPYGIAQSIIEHALRHTRYRVVALVQTKFLSAQRRYRLFTANPVEKVLVFSRRPSMPPGKMLQEHGEKIRGNGSIDFCWVVWQHGNTAPPEIDWIT